MFKGGSWATPGCYVFMLLFNTCLLPLMQLEKDMPSSLARRYKELAELHSMKNIG